MQMWTSDGQIEFSVVASASLAALLCGCVCETR